MKASTVRFQNMLAAFIFTAWTMSLVSLPTEAISGDNASAGIFSRELLRRPIDLFAKPTAFNPNCEAPKDHDEADICVQRDALEVSRKSLSASYTQSIASIAGLAALLWTLIYTARATKAAARASDAAQASTKIAEKQIRAYVGTNKIFFGQFRPDAEFVVILEITNYGSSPAINFSTNLRLGARENPLAAPFQDTPHPEREDRSTLMPSEVNTVTCTLNTPNQAELFTDIVSGRFALYVFGDINYTDAFGNAHNVKIRRMTYGQKALNSAPFTYPEEGNSST